MNKYAIFIIVFKQAYSRWLRGLKRRWSLLADFAGSNPAKRVDVCVSCVLCSTDNETNKDNKEKQEQPRKVKEKNSKGGSEKKKSC